MATAERSTERASAKPRGTGKRETGKNPAGKTKKPTKQSVKGTRPRTGGRGSDPQADSLLRQILGDRRLCRIPPNASVPDGLLDEYPDEPDENPMLVYDVGGRRVIDLRRLVVELIGGKEGSTMSKYWQSLDAAIVENSCFELYCRWDTGVVLDKKSETGIGMAHCWDTSDGDPETPMDVWGSSAKDAFAQIEEDVRRMFPDGGEESKEE